MKPFIWHTLALAGCLFLCACNNNQVAILSTNFSDEIEQQQNLEFTLSKDVYPDSLLGAWDSTAYVQFTPAVKGSFKWNSSHEIAFSPSSKFQPGTDYTAQLSDLILKFNPKKYSVSGSTLHFHTAPLRMQEVHVSWVKAKAAGNIAVQLDMTYNYPVDAENAFHAIHLDNKGQAIGGTLVSSGISNSLSMQFAPLNDRDEETPLTIQVDKGIAVPGSNYVSAKDTSLTISIPSRYNLEITDVSAVHTGNEGSINVSTSQPITNADLRSIVTVTPAVHFDVSLTQGGFRINSTEFSATQTYALSVAAKLEGEFGGKMHEAFSTDVTFGNPKPSVRFINTKGMYLSGAGFRNLALNIVNVPSVQVTVMKVYENNLEQFMRRSVGYDYHYERGEDETSYEYFNVEDLGDTVFNRVYETAKLPKLNAAHILHLDFADKLKDYNGVYVIRVCSREQNWIQESKIISISDIGLIVKEEKDNVYVFANSIQKATPLSGIKVTLTGINNQKMASVNTGSDGVAVFKAVSSEVPGFKLGLVTAKSGDEFSFVWLDKTRIGTSRFDVGGYQLNPTGLNAMIYPERNLYRPGETMHVATIVRGENWSSPGEVPVKIRLLMPNGKEFATLRKILNEEGSTEASFVMPPSAMTGTYTVQLITGNDVLLNAYEISVEDFVPDRMKVSLKTDRTEYTAGETIRTDIQADNLFGTPAAGRNFECLLDMEKLAFAPKNFADYDFNIANEVHFSHDLRTGKTGEKGDAAQSFSLKDSMANRGVLQADISATVFDETGRPVHRYTHVPVYTQPVFAGIRQANAYVATRVPLHIGLVAVDKNGIPKQSNVQVVVVRQEWHTVIQQNGGSYRYVSQSEDRVLSRQQITVGAPYDFTMVPNESGEYEVRVYTAGSQNYVSRSFYAWGSGDTQYTSFEVNNEGNVQIKPDKEKYAQGEDMNVLFTTPFEGRLLVTVERDKVIKYMYVNTVNKSASVRLRTEDVYLPNVYITATLFRPMNGPDMPLTVAHGFKSVPVENTSNRLPVKLQVVQKSRSRTRQSIFVKTAPGAFVTIAAVDEGILQVKNFASPSPYDFFYQKYALAVSTYDIYPWLLPEVGLRSSTGGDGEDKSAMRVNPMFVNRIKNVSFWSGILQADGSGNVRYDIDIPQFSGDIRVMAAAHKGRAFGSADQHIKVADPIVISTALPRFMSPKDEVMVAVSLSNTTAADMPVSVTALVNGPLAINGPATQSVNIPANSERRVIYTLNAQSMIGAGKITMTVKGANETFTNETEISIRPPASLQRITASGFADANTVTPLTLQNNFIAGTVSGNLVVGRSPLVQFSKNISNLVEYPFGCVEQTVSAAFPQLYYADLVKSITGSATNDANPALHVQAAINKLQSMQLGNGSLSYWPGGGTESWWGSIYAAHFLVEARKAGYEVNAATLDHLVEYMKYRLYKKEVILFYYNGNQTKQTAPEEMAYSLYVLALAGHAQQSTMNYYKAHTDLLTLDSRYLLSGAYSLAGQPVQAKETLPPAFAGEKPDHALGGSFYSYIRDEAISLNVLMDMDPGNAQVGPLARQLSQQMLTERYLNTQENAFGLLAMGKLARQANKTTATATITGNGSSLATVQEQPFKLDLKNWIDRKLAINVKGNGGFYYFSELNGITSDGSFHEEDSYLRVRRTFLDREGHEITARSFRQNDLVVIRISLETQGNARIDNVAITDMLPAGFEIENTRLTEMPALKWIKDEDEPDYRDIRDDRINLFTDAGGRTKHFYYMVRAVSPGNYQQGPVQADAMYNGTYHSYNGAGTIHITDK